jgi:methylmalonyl-CoA mutase N-terminal domain/subunit
MTINATAPVLLAMYVALADEQGVPRSALRGTVQNDIMKEYLGRGLYVFPPAPSLALSGDVIEFCVRELPRFNPVSMSAPHLRSAGALYTDALAYTFLAARLLVGEAIGRGLTADEIGPRVSFLVGADNDFFETVCRHRAARRLWARIMRDEFGAATDRAMHYRLAGSGNPLNMTAAQPLNNIARTALHGLANVLGGCQSLVLPCWDEAFTIPTEDAVRTSLNIQRILAYETNVTAVVDPLAGSYFVESLTDEVERRITDRMALVESRGGMVAAVEDGWIQQEMAAQAHRQERAIQDGDTVVVGVNRFTVAEDLDAIESTTHPPDPDTGRRQLRRLADTRADRDASAVDGALRAVRDACAGGRNVLPPLVDAVRARATIGEITEVMVEVHGRFRPRWAL